MKIKALIPVRSDSIRSKNKDIALFAGSSLLEDKDPANAAYSRAGRCVCQFQFVQTGSEWSVSYV